MAIRIRPILFGICLFGCVPLHAEAADEHLYFNVRSVHQAGFVEGHKVDIRYPCLVGSAKKQLASVNRELHQIINRCVGPFPPNTESLTFTCNYRIASQSSDRISIAFEFEIPNGGASQVTNRRVGYSCVVTNGAVGRASLDTYLKTRLNSSKLGAMVSSRLRVMGREYASPMQRSELRNFVVDETGGVTFFFDEGKLGAMALGAPEVQLSRAEIWQCR